jgi:uncharacterized OB-fold protein
MTRVPIEDGYFTIPDDPDEAPRLLGSQCPVCGEHFFPRRFVCARCLTEGCRDVLLGPRGRIHSWTWVHVPLFAKTDQHVSSYGVAQVDLPEGPRVQGILLGERDALTVGTEVELDLEVLGDGDGDGDAGAEVVIFRFRPVATERSERATERSP